MIQDRDKEKKNRGKTTRYHQLSEDLCGKLKNLNIRVCETPANTDNFSKMKDLRKNHFGDETINQIDDQFSNIKIVDEYNFPTSKKAETFDKIVLNIVCDNVVGDKENYKKDNINSDDLVLANENKKQIPGVGSKGKCFEQKTNGKLTSDSASSIDNEEEKKVVEDVTEPKCKVSDMSKKTKENNEVLCSRGPVSQKIYQQTFQPYMSYSRGLHSGGRVCVAEPVGPQIHPTVNSFQQLTNNIPHLNIISNEHEPSGPPVQTSYLHATDNQTNINITSEDIDRIIADLGPENCERAIQELSQIPVIKQCCDILRGPSSPEDSATSSLGSPYASQPPTSVSGMSDSGVGSPSHGVEYPADPHLQTLSFPNKTEYCNTWVTENCNSYTPGRRVQEWQATQGRPAMQDWQTTQERPAVQKWPAVQEWPTTQENSAVKEWQTTLEGPATQSKQTMYEEKVAQTSQAIHEKQIAQNSQTVHEKQIIQNCQTIHEKRISQNCQTIQEKQITQNCQTIHEKQSIQAIQERQTPPEKRSEVTKYRQILPKPEISSAKARFQQILDKDRRLLAWAKTRAEDPKKFESQDAEGDTDLMIVCSNKFEGHLELLYAMVELMRNIPNSLTITNGQGHSALYLACKVLSDVPVVAGYIAEALLEQKVDLKNMTYDGGHSLIQILEKEGDTHKKVLEELLALKDSSGKNVFQPSGNDVNANIMNSF